MANVKGAMTKCPKCRKNYSKEEASISHLFNLCPYCGTLFQRSINCILRFADLIELHKGLAYTYRLLQKGELTAAAREALLTLESNVRKKCGLPDLKGRELMSKAFSFEYDKEKKRVTRCPLIAINDLRGESQRNEQDGVHHIALGLMAGARNILAHNPGTITIDNALCIITTTHFILDHMNGITPVSSIR